MANGSIRRHTYHNKKGNFMEPTIFIPTNYTEAGKLLGMFEMRNVVECAVLCIPITLLCILLSPFGLTGTIILTMVLDITAGGFALIGIQDHSLFTFLRIYKRYKSNQKILTYRGTKWVKKKA